MLKSDRLRLAMESVEIGSIEYEMLKQRFFEECDREVAALKQSGLSGEDIYEFCHFVIMNRTKKDTENER